MGMLGNYLSVDAPLFTQITTGEVDVFDLDLETSAHLDIDKSWQAIHYLLCDEISEGEPPMGYVVPMLDDNWIDDGSDFGAFYITKEQVKEASEYLAGLDEERLKEKYDYTDMVENEIYPLYSDDDSEDFFEYLIYYINEIKAFFAETSQQGNALIFFIS